VCTCRCALVMHVCFARMHCEMCVCAPWKSKLFEMVVHVARAVGSPLISATSWYCRFLYLFVIVSYEVILILIGEKPSQIECLCDPHEIKPYLALNRST
jgi:hypothetical protein